MNMTETETLTTSTLNSTKYGTSPHRSQIVEKGLDIYLRNQKCKDALKWGTCNIAILLILLYDISNKCPYIFSKWYYLEYAIACFCGLNVLYHFGKLFYYMFSFEPLRGTEEQRKLLHFHEGDASFVTTPATTPRLNISNATMNITHLSWNSSLNDSNRSIISPGWTYNRGSPTRQQIHTTLSQSYSPNTQNTSWHSQQHASMLNYSNAAPGNASFNATPFTSPYKNDVQKEIITEERELQKYLKDVSSREEKQMVIAAGLRGEFLERNTVNTFGQYCLNAAVLLKSSLYQLSPITASLNKQTSNKDDLGIFTPSTDLDEMSEMNKIGASSQLTQYVYNLRMWIACTILQRLDAEITKTNSTFSNNNNAECRGFSDIQIGKVGLDRLKKTADIQQLVFYVPMLPMVIPFLEVSSNQEYLVQRIRDLSKGCMLGEYRWNSGGSYNGLHWGEHLPTDSAVIFHLFCTYLDSQLPPLPQPGGRPFFNRYVIMGDKKSPEEIKSEVKNKSNCAILCTNAMRPKFNFITNKTIHTCVQDRNNLFYVIVEFLIYMKTHNEGMLECVNLGRSGINLLRVIGD